MQHAALFILYWLLYRAILPAVGALYLIGVI